MDTPADIAATPPVVRAFSGKLSPPRLPGDAVRRGLLLQSVSAAAPRVLLVYAPVGFGKTTLLAQFYAEALAEGRRCAWVTLDERDNDISRFLLYLREAGLQLGCGDLSPPGQESASQDAFAAIARSPG